MGKTIGSEAVRLFFAVSALILVGMLTTPAGMAPPQQNGVKAERKIANTTSTAKVKPVKKHRSAKALKVANERRAKKLALRKG